MNVRLPAASLAILLMAGATPSPVFSQGPDLPQVPRLTGICLLIDGPKAGWSTFTASALGVRIPYPPDWSPREEDGGRRLTFVAGGQTAVRVRSVDTAGLSPLEWLQARLRTDEARDCRVVTMGSLVGHQCFNPTTRTWTTYLLTSNHVLAVEAPATLARATHCGMLMGVEDLAQP